ncbi:phospho-sugar mutase [Kibdelosporangium phytohabitans]|uniref:Phosphomannomutase n=1 Tax=Kibdelosporangium phytohabitans TaxID=860235 RepID=A0A0N9IES6_9PSEU|nr:phospho-sugar mutase [Kibdelosporangium phytohabitans]ALG13684.1 phosphomannomutase [Kibdelosporangium phytohabitans]MBE1465572.1 phosphomannomutase [Kibdelosporangium phytohabitans]
MRLTPQLRDKAFRWIADDVDPAARTELQQVLARAMGGAPEALAELEDRMSGPLTFGTAGLRGPVRAGVNGMNRSVVVRTTYGVATWLVHKGHGGGLVVVGRDARNGSAEFFRDVVAVLTAAGFQVCQLDGPLPTPITAFAVRHLGAVAGIQITASHNPPADNGYKLYDADGTQIVPPDDRIIEAAIRDAPAAVSIPRTEIPPSTRQDVVDAYLSRVATLPRGVDKDIKVVLTPMHGVGGDTALKALHQAGFTDVALVAAQAEPDPVFPTVAFPNPEEPGAADLLLSTAEEAAADLAIALDPDADRCALGVRDNGTWRMLRGDETGVLLGNHILAAGTPDALVATTIVSSSLLGSIAAAHGARYAETLTGFKWLVRAGEGLVFAYEEALGNSVDPSQVRDKDGISAAVVACDLAATLKAAGRTLLDVLDDLAVAHGVHVTDQVSLRVTDLPLIGRLMAKLRSAPPTALAGVPVTAEDLLPEADVLRLTGEGVRVVVRPSGTEPKLKAYLEVVSPVDGDLGAARSAARAKLAELRASVAELLGV